MGGISFFLFVILTLTGVYLMFYYHPTKGQAFREGGFTVWDWQGDRVTAVRSYVDTSLHAELTQGWRETLDPRIGRDLPTWEAPPRVRFPKTDDHE